MNRKSIAGMLGILIITAIIILGGIGVVNIVAHIIERQLLSEKMPSEDRIEVKGNYLQISYPWEDSKEKRREATEEEIKKFREAGYQRKLEQLASILGEDTEVDTARIYVNADNVLFHKGKHETDLSYAIDLDKGIIGIGIEAAQNTDIMKLEEAKTELITELKDPISEIYQFLPEINEFVLEYDGGIFEQSEQEEVVGRINQINSFPRQVLYNLNVLTVVLETSKKYIVLEYDPMNKKFTSCMVLT